MQGLLPAVNDRAPLSLANLSQHTRLQGIAPRRTVQLYLNDQHKTAGDYLLPPPPSDEFDHLDLTTFSRPYLSPARKRKADDDGQRDTALVLHGYERSGKGEGTSRSQAEEDRHAKKKPSLVAAMRPRLSSAAAHSSTSNSNAPRQAVGLVDRAAGSAVPSGSSSILIPRVSRKVDAAGAEATSPAKHLGAARFEAYSSAQAKKDKREDNRKDLGKGKENPVKEAKRSSAKKGKLRAEAALVEETEEVEERLRARRERRANKAFIRKDRTQSAAAVGTAAATKVKKAKRRVASDASDAASSESGKARRKKKKERHSVERVSRARMQGLQRPGTIGDGRLTLKPPKQVGIFNKGKASARTKVGQQLPDLAFSELNFLNSARRSPPLPSSPASSSSAENVRPAPASHQTKLPRTYGSKSNTRRTSKHCPTEGDSEPFDRRSRPTIGLAASKAKRTGAPTAPAAETTEKRRLVFSHVEVPIRWSSTSSLQSAPPTGLRSPTKLKTGLHRSAAAAAIPSSAATNDSALSAASLARRKSVREAQYGAALRQTPLDDLPNPNLRAATAAVAAGEQGASSYGGGFADTFQPGEENAGEGRGSLASSGLATSSLQRIIDEACKMSPQAGVAKPPPRPPGPFLTDQSMEARTESEYQQPSQNDGFIHLRDPPSFVQPGPFSGPSASIDNYETDSPAFELPSRAETHGELDQGPFSADETLLPDPAPSDAHFLAPFIAEAAGSAQTFLSGSSAPLATSSVVPAFRDAGEDVAFAGAIGGAFLRSSDARLGEANNLRNDAAFREAMRRQWPKARC
ncbi:hypothetical protein JCM11641_000933 [Rhodosporidiobolus odoratus]